MIQRGLDQFSFEEENQTRIPDILQPGRMFKRTAVNTFTYKKTLSLSRSPGVVFLSFRDVYLLTRQPHEGICDQGASSALSNQWLKYSTGPPQSFISPKCSTGDNE